MRAAGAGRTACTRENGYILDKARVRLHISGHGRGMFRHCHATRGAAHAMEQVVLLSALLEPAAAVSVPPVIF